MTENYALLNAADDTEELGYVLESARRGIAELYTAFSNATCTYKILLDSIETIRVLDARGAVTWRPEE